MNINMEELEGLLEAYRKRLSPGIYFFCSVYGDNKITIERENYPLPHHEDEYGVTFGFWENGYPPPELIGESVLKWINKYPFAANIKETSESFRGKLYYFLREKLL